MSRVLRMGLKPSCCTSCTADFTTFRISRNGYKEITSMGLSNMDKLPEYRRKSNSNRYKMPHHRFDDSTSKSLTRYE